ncbi:MAG: ABC transporter ATP-binding protein [Bacteroidales bacterium]|nr:ABC transporter ATP-binding protein [Bacteroidales bacterium]
MIQIQDIHKYYGDLHVLKGINLDIKSAEVVGITGASGAGKTTLLQILGTLDKPTSGQLFIGGQDVFALNEQKMAAFRNQNIGFVFQFHHLLPEFTCFENVCMPGLIAKGKLKEVEGKAKELLVYLNMEHRMDHKPSELSGGEQQRVAIARALINSPKIVFADEPSGNLDKENTEEIHKLFFKLRDDLGYTFVIVTHDDYLASLCDRTIHLEDGNIV